MKIDKKDSGAQYNKGRVLRALGKHKEALKYVDKAFETLEEDSEQYHQRAIILKNQNNITGALEDLQTSLKINPQNSGALYTRAMIFSQQSNFENALRDLDSAIAIENAEHKEFFYNGFAEIYKKQGKFELALEYAIKATETNPEFCYANGTMAEIYCLLNDDVNFFKCLEMAIDKGFSPDQLEEKITEKFKRDKRYKELTKKASNRC